MKSKNTKKQKRISAINNYLFYLNFLSISFVNSLSSPRSQSSVFSSPIPFKRAKSLNENRPILKRQKSAAPAENLTVDLDEIYRNNRKCPEIEKNLKQRKWRMASFRATLQVAEIIFSRWEPETKAESDIETRREGPSHRARKQQFSNYVVGFVMRVGPSVATLLHALLYTLRLREIYPRACGEKGCSHRLFVVSLLVAVKYLNDRQILIKPSHSTWSSLSGVFTSPELERMEMEFVTFLKGKLFIGAGEMDRCVEEMFFDNEEGSLVVPGSVDWLELISIKAKVQDDQRVTDGQVP